MNAEIRDTNRIAVFVDVSSLFFAAKSIYQSKVDYAALMKKVMGDRVAIRAIAYVLQRPDVNQKSFIQALEQTGLQARVKEMKMRFDAGGREIPCRTSWATGITVEALTIAPRVGTVVLATDDPAFVPLAETFKSMGCRVEIAGFRSEQNELAAVADRFIAIDELVFKDRKFGMAASGRSGQTYEGLPQDDDLEREASVAGRWMPD